MSVPQPSAAFVSQPRPVSEEMTRSGGAGETKHEGKDGQMEAPEEEPMTLYKLVVTPITFVSFLISLLLVDIRYTSLRTHSHDSPSRLPQWLHDTIYRPRPYEYKRVDAAGTAAGGGGGEKWYYHTKQKKLMRMEATEAFEMRNVIVLGLCAGVVLGGLGSWYLGRLVLRKVFAALGGS